VAEALRERNRRRRLAFARLRRCDRRHVDQLAVASRRETVEHREVDLRLVAAIRLDFLVEQACGPCDLRDRAKLRLLSDPE